MYGKSVYDLWVTRYGVIEADRRRLESNRKRSLSMIGCKNPMYGKTTPCGCGNGWGGWYKGWYFRSLRELSYMIQVIEKNSLKWRTAETADLTVNYIDKNGTPRTYRADFLLNDKLLVEIKPKQLMQLPANILKRDAAIAFCSHRRLEYSIVDSEILPFRDLLIMFKDGVIRFIDKYQKRMSARSIVPDSAVA